MAGVYELLSGEPWCWTREEINGETDWYLWEIVIRPAVRKSRELERKNNGRGKVGHGWEDSKKKLPNRDQYILIGARLGVPKEVSEREYDKFIADRKKGK
jgi:hypothetical protein